MCPGVRSCMKKTEELEKEAKKAKVGIRQVFGAFKEQQEG